MKNNNKPPEETFLNCELVCPYCLTGIADSWELGCGSGTDSGYTECEQCDAEFEWERVIGVTYTGRPLTKTI